MFDLILCLPWSFHYNRAYLHIHTSQSNFKLVLKSRPLTTLFCNLNLQSMSSNIQFGQFGNVKNSFLLQKKSVRQFWHSIRGTKTATLIPYIVNFSSNINIEFVDWAIPTLEHWVRHLKHLIWTFSNLTIRRSLGTRTCLLFLFRVSSAVQCKWRHRKGLTREAWETRQSFTKAVGLRSPDRPVRTPTRFSALKSKRCES